MSHHILLALSAAMLCASAAAAADRKPRPGYDPNKVICRTTADTGSRLNRSRACHTAAEWDEIRRQTKAKIEYLQNFRPWSM